VANLAISGRAFITFIHQLAPVRWWIQPETNCDSPWAANLLSSSLHLLYKLDKLGAGADTITRRTLCGP